MKQNLQVIQEGSLLGAVLQERYQVGSNVGNGEFGSVYNCEDKKRPYRELTIKISPDINRLTEEIHTLIRLQKKTKESGKLYPYNYFP